MHDLIIVALTIIRRPRKAFTPFEIRQYSHISPRRVPRTFRPTLIIQRMTSRVSHKINISGTSKASSSTPARLLKNRNPK